MGGPRVLWGPEAFVAGVTASCTLAALTGSGIWGDADVGQAAARRPLRQARANAAQNEGSVLKIGRRRYRIRLTSGGPSKWATETEHCPYQRLLLQYRALIFEVPLKITWVNQTYTQS